MPAQPASAPHDPSVFGARPLGPVAPPRDPNAYGPRPVSAPADPNAYGPRPVSAPADPNAYGPRPVSPPADPSAYGPRPVSDPSDPNARPGSAPAEPDPYSARPVSASGSADTNAHSARRASAPGDPNAWGHRPVSAPGDPNAYPDRPVSAPGDPSAYGHRPISPPGDPNAYRDRPVSAPGDPNTFDPRRGSAPADLDVRGPRPASAPGDPSAYGARPVSAPAGPQDPGAYGSPQVPARGEPGTDSSFDGPRPVSADGPGTDPRDYGARPDAQPTQPLGRGAMPSGPGQWSPARPSSGGPGASAYGEGERYQPEPFGDGREPADEFRGEQNTAGVPEQFDAAPVSPAGPGSVEPVTAPPFVGAEQAYSHPEAAGVEPVTAPPADSGTSWADSVWERTATPETPAEPEAPAADDETHGLGWLLSQSGLGQVSSAPAQEAEPEVSPEAAENTRPVSAWPVSAAPISADPANTDPISTAPASADPVSAVPASAAPVSAEPVSGVPVSAAPVSAIPISTAPAGDDPVSGGPVSAAPVSAVPVSAAPVKEDWFVPSGALPIIVPAYRDEQPGAYEPEYADTVEPESIEPEVAAEPIEDLGYHAVPTLEPDEESGWGEIEAIVVDAELIEPTSAEPISVRPISAEPVSAEPIDALVIEPFALEPAAEPWPAQEPEPAAAEEPERVLVDEPEADLAEEPQSVLFEEPETAPAELVEDPDPEPETVEPETVVPEAVEPETTEPETVEPENPVTAQDEAEAYAGSVETADVEPPDAENAVFTPAADEAPAPAHEPEPEPEPEAAEQPVAAAEPPAEPATPEPATPEPATPAPVSAAPVSAAPVPVHAPIRQRRPQPAEQDRRRQDPEQVLAAYPLVFDPETLREQIEETDPMWVVVDRLTDKLEYAERDTVRARLLSLRAVAGRLLGDLDRAETDGRAALEHAQQTGDLRLIATTQARLAHVLQWKGEFAEADRIYAEAASPELPPRLGAEVHELAGRSAFEQRRYLEAMNHFETALDLRKGADPELVERIELALDVITRHTGDGWGPYPRTREEILGEPVTPRPLRDERSGLWGYVGAVPPRYAQAQPFADGVAWVRRPEAPAWELIDESGGVLIDASSGYLAAGRFSEGMAWVARDQQGGWFAIDHQNRVIVPGGFEDARPFHRGLALIRRGGWGAIDRHGRVVVQPRYRAFATALVSGPPIDGFTDEGLAVVDAGDRFGVVDRTGQLIVAPVHAAVRIHPAAFVIADKFGLWGALNRDGEPMIELKYSDRADVLDQIDRLAPGERPVL
jgi:tetratricopeptide (TPR) repeat protein